MKVTRLEINGFKSFAERTVVDFPDGLCAVVGPNGCGKSNVVDAIRWVLGEQSAKQLRGHAMEDVIFNGSDGQSPAGMGEVSLVFENQGDVTAPAFADLSEIMVTRRLYRSGESEYMINRVPCRLKDIHQLFMDTGLGNRDYAIIEQGRVAAFIESKPVERRLWVEEAAGITRYKNQKKVSLRKMQAAKDNLDRLQDIIVEVGTQMARLKRQAKKAERHQEVRQKIRELDLAISGLEYDQLTNLLQEASAEAEAVGARLLLAQQRLTGLETDQETLRVRLVAAEQEIDAAGARKLEAEGAIQKAENELTLMGREIQNTKRIIERFSAERQEHQAKVRQQEKELAQAQRVVNRSQDRQAEAAAALEQASRRLSEGLAALEGWESALDQAKTKLVEHLGSVNQHANRLADLDRAEHDLGRRARQTEQREEALQGEIDELTLRRDQAAHRSDQLGHQLAEMQQEINRITQDHQEVKARIKELTRAEARATRQEHQAAAAVDALGLSLANHDWAQDGVRAVLKAAQNGRLPVEVLGVVADRLKVQPGSEEMVEAALGDELQALMVKDDRDARRLAAWVESQGLGRIRLLALSRLKAGAAAPPLESTPLGELVQPTSGFEALWNLLNPVGWCQEAEAAWSASAAMRPGQVVVSRSGQRLDRPGAALVGKNDAGSVLARRNQLEQKQQELTQAQAEREKILAQLAAAEQELTALEQELSRLEQKRRECHQESAQVRQVLVESGEALKAKQRQLETLRFDSEDIQEQLARISDQRQKLAHTLEELEEQTPELEAHLERCQQELAQGRRRLEDDRRAESQARLNEANLQSEMNAARKDLARLKEDLARRGERIEALAAEIDAAGRSVESLEARRNETQVKLAELYEDLDRQQEALRQARELHSRAQVKSSDLEAALKQARAELKQAESESAEIALNQHKLAMQRDQLAEQVMERCRVDLTTDYQTYRPQGAFDLPSNRERLAKLRNRLHRMGPVNMEAISEHEVLSERHRFLTEQREDLSASLEDLRSAVRKINRTSRKRFTDTLEEANQRLAEVFPVLFSGGSATLTLEEGVDPLDAGLHIMVELPGKKIRTLESLSGGEKALTAVAVLFALFLIRPAPFCILDEVDAPMDEANIGRFHDLLSRLSQRSQIVMITHNRRTMEMVQMLYGVTMEQKGVSKLLAVTLQEGEAMAA